jgi:hypothetical protein
MERLAGSDPIAFLREALKRYDLEVKGYHCTLLMHEPNKTTSAPQKITADFREEPFSVRMEWLKGAGEAGKIVYVKGANDGQMLVRGAGWRRIAGVVRRDPTGQQAMGAARIPVSKFGIRIGMQRVLDAWQKARGNGDLKTGNLKIEFLGEKEAPKLGGRVCWVLRGTSKKPDPDGISVATFYFDKETWLMAGSILKDKDGGLIGSYWFKDIRLNPTFGKDTFTKAGL